MEQFIYSSAFAAYVGPDSLVATVLIWVTFGMAVLFWVLYLFAQSRSVKMWLHRKQSCESPSGDTKNGYSRERVKPFPMKDEDFYQKMTQLDVGDWLEIFVTDKFYFGRSLLIFKLASFYPSRRGPRPYGACTISLEGGVSICTINPAENRYVVWSGGNPTKYWVVERIEKGQRNMKFILTRTEGTLATLIEEQQRFN